jgi:hypothetical protein
MEVTGSSETLADIHHTTQQRTQDLSWDELSAGQHCYVEFVLNMIEFCKWTVIMTQWQMYFALL